MQDFYLILAMICAWAVFAPQVRDGIIVKHCLVFGSMFALLYALTGLQSDMIACNLTLMLGGLYLWFRTLIVAVREMA